MKKGKEIETKHKYRPRSQIEIKHKWNPDHNPSQNHQWTQPPIHVHNTHMQASKFFLFPLFSRHQDPTASMIKTSKISLLICSLLVNIGWGRKRCENHWSQFHNHWSGLQYRIGDWVLYNGAITTQKQNYGFSFWGFVHVINRPSWWVRWVFFLWWQRWPHHWVLNEFDGGNLIIES